MLQNNPELQSAIKRLWDKFWSGGISNPLTAIEQITYSLMVLASCPVRQIFQLSSYHIPRPPLC